MHPQQTSLQTYALYIQDQHDTQSIHSTNAYQCKVIISIIVVYLEDEMVQDRITYGLILLHQIPITASSKVNRTRSNSYKRTSYLSTTNMTPVPYIKRAKINVELGSPLL